MNKKEVETSKKEVEKLEFKGKTNKELEEVVQVLQTQLEQHQTMVVKAQGALEVVLQMLPKEETIES